MVFGYQPELWEDGEPNTEEPSAGETNKKLVGSGSVGFSVVWVESIRERVFGIGQSGVAMPESSFTTANQLAILRNNYFNDLYSVMAHEIGHSPGPQNGDQDYAEDGIMRIGAGKITSKDFEPPTIKRFRSAESWTK